MQKGVAFLLFRMYEGNTTMHKMLWCLQVLLSVMDLDEGGVIRQVIIKGWVRRDFSKIRPFPKSVRAIKDSAPHPTVFGNRKHSCQKWT